MERNGKLINSRSRSKTGKGSIDSKAYVFSKRYNAEEIREKSQKNVEEEKSKRHKDKEKKKITKDKKKIQLTKRQKQKKNISYNDIKKVPSSMNLSTKSKKTTKSSEKKRHKMSLKSPFTSARYSKPISAREERQNLRKKLFSNKKQTPIEVINIKKEIIKNSKPEKTEASVKKIMNELKSALQTVGSKKKLTKKLEVITEKIKNLALNLGSEESEQSESQQSSNNLRNITEEKEKYLDRNIDEDESNERTQKIYDENQPLENSDFFAQFDIIKQISKISIKNEGNDERKMEEINIDQHIILTNESKEELPIKKQIPVEMDKSEEKIESQEKKQPEEPMKKEEDDEAEDYLRNPMLGRRNYNEVQIDIEYESVKSHDEKQKEIEMLKKFKEESTKMMEKVASINKRNIQLNTQIKQQQPQFLNKEKTPTQMYAFEKYPKIDDLKSPKVNQQQILSIISLKEKVAGDKHNKLSQLVQVMQTKTLLSPKTYEIQMNVIKKQFQEENQMIQNYKKHAQELSKLLSDIRKERQEIYGIDELIRSEKWNQAMQIVQKNKHLVNEKPKLPRQENKSKQYQENSSDDDQNEVIYYSGDHSSDAEPAIRLQLIEVDHEEKEDNLIPIDESSQSIIKIDENEITQEKPSRKGFESNLYFIKEYCIALCEFVRDKYGESFKNNIGNALQFCLPDLLKAYRTLKNGEKAETINSIFQELTYHQHFRKATIPPIEKQIFQEFNKNYESLRYYGKEESENAQLQGIFLESIYNSLNQSLNYERPGGLSGKALPWAHSSKHLKNYKNKVRPQPSHQQHAQSEDLIFGIAIARIIQWGSCLCGFIPDTVELQNTDIDQEYVNHIRETRMALLLEKMLSEQENQMIESQLQETEVKLGLTLLITQELLMEEAEELRKITKRRVLREVDY